MRRRSNTQARFGPLTVDEEAEVARRLAAPSHGSVVPRDALPGTKMWELPPLHGPERPPTAPPRSPYRDAFADIPDPEWFDEPPPPPLIPSCPICQEPLKAYLCTEIVRAGMTAHVRCLDWTGKPFPTLRGLQQARALWPRLPARVRAAILDACQAWARLERGWPPDPLTGEAVEAVVVAAVDLRETVRCGIRRVPGGTG